MMNEVQGNEIPQSFARLIESPSGEFEVRVRGNTLPATLPETGAQLFVIEDAIKRLEARREILKRHGINQICRGEPNVVGEIKQEGIRYVGFERKNVSWQKATERIIEELVPKTKHEDAEIIVNGFTKTSVIQKLEPTDAE